MPLFINQMSNLLSSLDHKLPPSFCSNDSQLRTLQIFYFITDSQLR